MKIKLSLILLFLLLFGGASAEAQSLLWEVSGKDLQKPSYLFGTYHLLKDEYLQEHHRVLEELEKAEVIMVEVDEDSASLVQATIAAGMMQENSLSNLLDSAEYAMVGQELQASMGYPIQAFNQFKPSFLNITLSMLYIMEELPEVNEYEGALMDGYIIEEGKAKGKKIVALETGKEQLELLFNHYPLEEQADQLVEVVQEKGKMLDYHKKMLQSYLDQDLELMMELNESWAEEFGDLSYLTDDRNKNWMPALLESIQENPTFVAVGAAHLPGENGLIALLEAEGYTLKPVGKICFQFK